MVKEAQGAGVDGLDHAFQAAGNDTGLGIIDEVERIASLHFLHLMAKKGAGYRPACRFRRFPTPG